MEVKVTSKIAIIVLRSEGPFLDRASPSVVEGELREILTAMEPSKRIPRYWSLEKITVLDA
jgi:hypothetical protein